MVVVMVVVLVTAFVNICSGSIGVGVTVVVGMVLVVMRGCLF